MLNVAEHKLNHNDFESRNDVVLNKSYGSCGDDLILRLLIHVTEVDLFRNDRGVKRDSIKIKCVDGRRTTGSSIVTIKEGSNVGKLTFDFKINTKCVKCE